MIYKIRYFAIYLIASDFIINILLHFTSFFLLTHSYIFGLNISINWFYINFYCIRKEYSSLQKSFRKRM